MCYFCLGRKSIFGALVPQWVTFTVQFDLLLSCKLYSTASVCFDAPAASGSVRFFLLLRNDPKDFPQVACTRRSYRFFLNPVLSSFSSSLSTLSFSFLSCFFFQRAIGIDTVQRVEKFPFDRSDVNVFYFELFKDRRRNCAGTRTIHLVRDFFRSYYIVQLYEMFDDKTDISAANITSLQRTTSTLYE